MIDDDLFLNDLRYRIESAHRANPGTYEPATDVWQRAKSQIDSG